MTWQKLSSVEKYKNRYMTVMEDVLLTDHGDQVTFGVVRKEPAVYIIPWDGERFTLVGQYRYPVDAFSWEFPAGHMEHTNLEVAAKTELQEETGLIANKLVKIGSFFVAPGHNTQIGYAYLATGLTKNAQKLETAEKGMQIKAVTPAELNTMISRKEVRDGPTITSFKLFELYLAKQQSHE